MSTLLHFVRAVRFAADKHAGQTRKGEAGEPYFNHLAEVAQLVAEATGGRDPELVVAALLHDTLEDTATTFDELSLNFGENVASLVREVTSDKSLSRDARRAQDVELVVQKTNRAKIIKLGDKIANVKAVIHSPPAEWSVDEREAYVDFAEAMFKQLLGLNRVLETEMKTVLSDARKELRAQRFKS